VKSTCQSHIALIGKRGDHKTRSVTKVLISISESSISLASKAIEDIFFYILPVVPELFLPFEIIHGLDSALDHSTHDFSSVHIDHNQGAHQGSLLSSKFTTD
jgi:hypothetical protein